MSSSPTERAGSIEMLMPQLGVSVTEGTIARWLLEVGERIALDEPVCEVSTDKIDVDIPSPADGILERILVEEGETVEVGTPIAVIAAEVEAPASEQPLAPETGDGAGSSGQEIDRSRFYSPVVRRIAEQAGVDLAAVVGNGIGGRVRKTDLLAHITAQGSADGGNGSAPALHTESPYRPEPEPGPEAMAAGLEELIGPTRSEPIDSMRRAIGEHMIASRRRAAHCTTVVEADFSAVAEARARHRDSGEGAQRGVSLTYLAFVCEAVVTALGEHPILNASLADGEIIYHQDINLGIAVALDRGLVVPVIRKAQHLGIEGLAVAIAELATAAREGRLAPDDLAGGTFTVTNPGQFGAVIATPIINQPQVAILDLEAVVRRPVVVEDRDGAESIGIRPMSYLCMSWDHRALDGAEAARFLAKIRDRLERRGSR